MKTAKLQLHKDIKTRGDSFLGGEITFILEKKKVGALMLQPKLLWNQ